MIKEYQVTIFCEDRSLRPISTIVKRTQTSDYDALKIPEEKKDIKTVGIRQIRQRMNWLTPNDFKIYGSKYNKVKMRQYEKITKANLKK